jgi:hypothetical protein
MNTQWMGVIVLILILIWIDVIVKIKQMNTVH